MPKSYRYYFGARKEFTDQSFQKFKIFMVDDDPFILNYYAQHLQGIGCTDVSTFLTGEECIDHLVEKPNVVFLDYHLDTQSGIEILGKIKTYDHDIYVIFLSDEERDDLIKLAVNLGAFDFFIKGKYAVSKIESALRKIEQIFIELNRKRN
jgi:polysaccharide export outer membrane protein